MKGGGTRRCRSLILAGQGTKPSGFLKIGAVLDPWPKVLTWRRTIVQWVECMISMQKFPGSVSEQEFCLACHTSMFDTHGCARQGMPTCSAPDIIFDIRCAELN